MSGEQQFFWLRVCSKTPRGAAAALNQLMKLHKQRFIADVGRELHEASLLRNKLLSRAVGVITSLQSDTDNLIYAAADLQHDGTMHLGGESPHRRLQAAKLPNPQQYTTPAIQIPTRFKSTAAGAADSDHAYQRSMYSAAEQRNLLLKRAYDVISNLQVCRATHAPLQLG